MEKRGWKQEELKILACVSMLLDHIGAVLLPLKILRIIGRISFPIYCFLLAQGARHTHNPKKYVIRLLVAAIVSEIPFDLYFYGSLTLQHQNVFLTLFLGLAMILVSRSVKYPVAYILPFALVAEFIRADYGAWGIFLIAIFAFTEHLPHARIVQTIALCLLFCIMPSSYVTVLSVKIPTQLFGAVSMLPISLYCGQKREQNRLVQWMFYLFYPAHILILLFIHGM